MEIELYIVPLMTNLDLDNLGKHIVEKIPRLSGYRITEEPRNIENEIREVVSGSGYSYKGFWVEDLNFIEMRPLDRFTIDPQLLVTDQQMYSGGILPTPWDVGGISNFILHGRKVQRFQDHSEQVNRFMVSTIYRRVDTSETKRLDKRIVHKAATRKIAESLANKCFEMVGDKLCLLSNFTSPTMLDRKGRLYTLMGDVSDDYHFLEFEGKLADGFCEKHQKQMNPEEE
jgi:hypothetical protein